VLNYRYSISRK